MRLNIIETNGILCLRVAEYVCVYVAFSAQDTPVFFHFLFSGQIVSRLVAQA